MVHFLMTDELTPKEPGARREAAKPFTRSAKAKPSARPPATKAEHASFKKSNKMAFKPAPKKS
jgi:hypothetical protein